MMAKKKYKAGDIIKVEDAAILTIMDNLWGIHDIIDALAFRQGRAKRRLDEEIREKFPELNNYRLSVDYVSQSIIIVGKEEKK